MNISVIYTLGDLTWSTMVTLRGFGLDWVAFSGPLCRPELGRFQALGTVSAVWLLDTCTCCLSSFTGGSPLRSFLLNLALHIIGINVLLIVCRLRRVSNVATKCSLFVIFTAFTFGMSCSDVWHVLKQFMRSPMDLMQIPPSSSMSSSLMLKSIPGRRHPADS